MNQFIIEPLNVGHGESIFLRICQEGREFNLLVDGGSYRESKDSYKRAVFYFQLRGIWRSGN